MKKVFYNIVKKTFKGVSETVSIIIFNFLQFNSESAVKMGARLYKGYRFKNDKPCEVLTRVRNNHYFWRLMVGYGYGYRKFLVGYGYGYITIITIITNITINRITIKVLVKMVIKSRIFFWYFQSFCIFSKLDHISNDTIH